MTEPFEKSWSTVSFQLSLQMTVRSRLEDVTRETLQPAAVAMDEMYIRSHSFSIFKMKRMKLCTDSKINWKYTCGTSTSVWKPSCSMKKNGEDSDTLSKVCSASSWTCPVVQVVEDRCGLAACVVLKRTKFWLIFFSVKSDARYAAGFGLCAICWGMWCKYVHGDFLFHYRLILCLWNIALLWYE